MMRTFLSKPNGRVTKEAAVQHDRRGEQHSMCEFGSAQPQTVSVSSVSSASVTVITHEIFTAYIPDIEEDDDNNEEIHTYEKLDWENVSDGPFRVRNPPPPIKRRCHNIPIHVARKRQRLEVEHNLQQALIAIEKAI